MAGAVLVVGLDALRAPTLGLGSLLGLLAAAFYGGYFLLNQRGPATVDILTYFWISAASTGLALFLVALALLAGPLLGESLTPGQILGEVVVPAGVYVVHRSRAASPPPA